MHVAVAREEARRARRRSDVECACKGACASGRIDNHAATDVTARGCHTRSIRQHAGDGARLPNRDSQLFRALQQQVVEVRAPNLVAAPRAIIIATERLEATRTSPLDPDAGVTRARDFGQAIGDTKLREQWLDAGMQCFARTITWKRLTLEQHDAQTALRACNRRGTAGRTAARDYDVGIDESSCHSPVPRFSMTVVPSTYATTLSTISTSTFCKLSGS